MVQFGKEASQTGNGWAMLRLSPTLGVAKNGHPRKMRSCQGSESRVALDVFFARLTAAASTVVSHPKNYETSQLISSS